MAMSPVKSELAQAATAAKSELTQAAAAAKSELAQQNPVEEGGFQGQVVAGLQAGLARVQETAQASYDATHKRVTQARAGNALLAHGKGAETAIRAKVVMAEAYAQNTDVVQRATLAASKFQEAAVLLRSAKDSAENLPEGITGVEGFARLAETYQARAAVYKRLLEALAEAEELPPLPELSPAEQDAARILQMHGHIQVTTQRVSEGAQYVQQRSWEAMPESRDINARGQTLRSKLPCC